MTISRLSAPLTVFATADHTPGAARVRAEREELALQGMRERVAWASRPACGPVAGLRAFLDVACPGDSLDEPADVRAAG